MKRLSLIFFILLPVIANAQESEIWDFPIKSGTEEWAALNIGQIRESCQIPQDILMALSTENLTKVCLNYPLYMNYMVYNNERDGINVIIEEFNGLTELSKREDGVLALIKLYDNYPVASKKQYEELKREQVSSLKLIFIELLLSNDLFIVQLDAQGLDLLKKAVLKKYEAKLENPEVYSLYNVRKTLLLGAIISERDDRITKSSEQWTIIKRYIEQYRHVEPSVLTEISKIVSDL